MKRSEIKICLGTLAVGVALLSSLWGYLMSSTMYNHPPTGKRAYTTGSPDRPLPW